MYTSKYELYSYYSNKFPLRPNTFEIYYEFFLCLHVFKFLAEIFLDKFSHLLIVPTKLKSVQGSCTNLIFVYMKFRLYNELKELFLIILAAVNISFTAGKIKCSPRRVYRTKFVIMLLRSC